MSFPRITGKVCLAAALLCASTIGGRAASPDGNAGPVLEPVTSQSQTWSIDRYIVDYANKALAERDEASLGRSKNHCFQIAKFRRSFLR
jgi:hypothetical protein